MAESPSTTVAAPPKDEPTITYRPNVLSAHGVFEEELRRLLRSRLLLFQLLTIAYAILLLVMAVLTPQDSQVRRDVVPPSFWVMMALPLIGIVAIGRSPGMSLRSLRLWELFQFGSQAAINGAFRFTTLALATAQMPSPEVGFRGAVSLFGIMTLILAYGVLIPNTRRRSLVVVLGLTAVPFVTLAAAVAINPALRWEHAPALAFQAIANLLIPAAVAVFAAARADALQRRAFEAERRAEQVGPYLLQRKLGEGGMGEVWLAEHRMLKRPCAIKFVRPELAAHPATAARFAREVQAVTGLTHMHTVRVYDYGRTDAGAFYYVMEYLDGPTLEQLVKDHGPLAPGRAVYILRQLCGALAEAHAAGLVHRDLKPSNVIIARLGGVCDVAKLLDFGLVLDESGTDAKLTRAGMILGTPAYMTPEQASGEPVDARGDVYSLGAVLFFALVGKPPFEGKSAGQMMAAHRLIPAPTPDGISADLAAVVTRCLAKDPVARYQTVSDLDVALADCACSMDWSARQAATWWESVLNTKSHSSAQAEPTISLG